MNVDSDRLSSLSDDLIHRILSYNDTKDAIRTSILSSRWKNSWKSIPHLDLSSRNHESLPKFYKCVKHVLSSRNNEIELVSMKLQLGYLEEFSEVYVTKIMKYAFSHDVQKLTIIGRFGLFGNHIKLPHSSFISESLKDLTLTRSFRPIKITSSWDILALTSLHLDNVIIDDDNYGNLDEPVVLFSKCPNLKNLTLTNCDIYDWNGFTIFHSQLSNLTLENGQLSSVNVVAPHLKALTVVNCTGRLIISTPELSSLKYDIRDHLEFSSDGFSSLEKANFYIFDPDKKDAPEIIDVLQQFCNVKYLTLGLEIVEVLASCVQLVSHLPSPFANLMSFKIYPANLHFSGSERRSKCSRMKDGGKNINMPTEVKNYLLDGSPCATVTIFSREELQELENAKSAEEYMAELQKLLEEQKIKFETNRTHTDESKAPMERHIENINDQGDTQNDVKEQLVKEEISHVNKCWYDLFEQIKKGGLKINRILSMLRMIEDLLENLPASKKDGIQARFYSLRAEAYSVITLITRSKMALGSAFMNSLQNLSF